MKRISATDQEIIEVSNTSHSATQAAQRLGIQYGTYRVHALRLGVFKANQGGLGTSKPKKEGAGKISLKDILEGKHPEYQTNKLRKRLFNEGYKEKKCEVCDITEWNGKELSFQLEHIDGNSYNHSLNNLMIICPNCHSQTDTYCGRNKTK
jgi:hypothetical protein